MSSASEQVVDRLSSMPDDVVSHILSLMPTKFAVRTSMLSQRWRYSWTLVHNLDFDDSERREYGFLPTFVDSVLDRCKTSQVKKFRVNFPNFYVPESYVSEWISKAIRLNVRELEIKVIKHLMLPLSFFTCKTLTRLKLNHIEPFWFSFDCPSDVNLPNLKTLDVVILDKMCEKAMKFIHGCPTLENLYVELRLWDCEGDFYFKIPTLRRLNLIVKDCTRESVTNDVILNLPNLEYFSFHGVLCMPFVTEDMSSLVEAKASCVVYHDDMWVQLLKGICEAKSLSLKTEYRSSNEECDLPKFLNLKQLELQGYVGYRWQLITQFLERSPELEHLSIIKAEHGYRWNKPKSIPTCMRMNFETIKYTKGNGYGYCDMQFLKFILLNAKVLKMLTVECNTKLSLSKDDKESFRAKLLKIQKASRNCEIQVVGSWPA
ncbi:FBD-like protein [Artemisia annua]|uniref:FBD-like protein n=1 Tax=Artemisia annua TaxID=35608 RepID=A0A2U1L0X2_ARTAN|nr:FBD-like protein [Artemisia annua]